jgi:hypothetical protein
MKNFSTNVKVTTMAAALAAAGFLPNYAAAESNFQTGAGALTAPARHDFSIVIPKFLFLQVGAGTNMANDGTINQIDFTVAAANVGDSTPVAGTGGNVGGTAASVVVKGNNGQVTITETNNSGGAGLTNAAGDAISYNQISTSSSAGSLPAPALSNAGGSTSLPTLAGKVTNQSANWTYSYLNATTPAPGTYGTSARGGRVTYTATMP